MIEAAHGDLLTADVEALVNTVNCVGVMGKGLALQFKRAFPGNFRAYAAACKRAEVRPGAMFVFEEGEGAIRRVIINFPTKRHFRDASRLEDIEAGLVALVGEVEARGITSIAVPPLGCGLGGLAWSDVEPRIRAALSAVPRVRVLLFGPGDAPVPAVTSGSGKPAAMTRGRAMLLALLDEYLGDEDGATRVELQKLGYFLQEAGEPLKLDFVKHHFGPYARNLDHVLQRMDGALLTGGDGAGRSPIVPVPGAVAEAEAFVSALGDDARARLARARDVMSGFETPYGMELLASVHWVATRDLSAGHDTDAVIEAVQAWNERKRRVMQPAHIRVAYERLRSAGWLPV